MQRAQADLRLGNDRGIEFFELAVEPVQHLGQFQHRAGGRELAGAYEVLAVRAGVHAVRILGHRNVRGERGLGVLVGLACAIHHRHLGFANGLELAFLDGRFDAGNVEKQAGVAFGGHHVLVAGTHLDVVLIGGGELAVIRGGNQVAVAVNQHLPANFHGLGIDAAEHRAVLAGVLSPCVGQRDGKLATAEDAGGVVDGRIHRVALVRENAMKALHIGQLGDLVTDEIVETDARNAGVDLVIDPGVAAIVVAVLVGGVCMVRVGNVVAQVTVGLGAHDRLGFVGDAPTDQGVGDEAGNAQQLTARWHAQHAHVARVAAAPDAVIGIKFTGLEVNVGGAMGGG